jgi:hypothetical protein
MTCPQCNERISARSLLTPAGLSGVVCTNCQAALCPKPISAILVFAVSFGLGDLALMFLRHKGAEFWVACLGFFVVFAAVFALTAPVFLRMRLKDHADPHLSGHRA